VEDGYYDGGCHGEDRNIESGNKDEKTNGDVSCSVDNYGKEKEGGEKKEGDSDNGNMGKGLYGSFIYSVSTDGMFEVRFIPSYSLAQNYIFLNHHVNGDPSKMNPFTSLPILVFSSSLQPIISNYISSSKFTSIFSSSSFSPNNIKIQSVNLFTLSSSQNIRKSLIHTPTKHKIDSSLPQFVNRLSQNTIPYISLNYEGLSPISISCISSSLSAMYFFDQISQCWMPVQDYDTQSPHLSTLICDSLSFPTTASHTTTSDDLKRKNEDLKRENELDLFEHNSKADNTFSLVIVKLHQLSALEMQICQNLRFQKQSEINLEISNLQGSSSLPSLLLRYSALLGEMGPLAYTRAYTLLKTISENCYLLSVDKETYQSIIFNLFKNPWLNSLHFKNNNN
jgi:hypothetical protein